MRVQERQHGSLLPALCSHYPHVSTSAPWQSLFNLLGSEGVSLVKNQIRVGATAQLERIPSMYEALISFNPQHFEPKKKIRSHKDHFWSHGRKPSQQPLNPNTQAGKNDQILRCSSRRIQPMPPLRPPRSRSDSVIDRHTTCYQCHCACYMSIEHNVFILRET